MSADLQNQLRMHIVKANRFVDTFCVFLILLSFSKVYLLPLSFLFIIAKYYKDFIANSFITIFLSKKLFTNEDTLLSVQNNGPNTSSSWSISIFCFNMVFSTVLILLAGKNVMDPINILSASILASSMVNAHPDRLYSAIYCSMIFSFAKYILDSPAQQKYSLLLTSALPGLKPILSTLQSQNLIHQEYFQFINIENENLNNYIDILLYYLAFHIVVTQIINDIVLRRRRKPLLKI